MADIKLNFSSQWPSIQVAKVIPSPQLAGEDGAPNYNRKIKHNLGYPPLALGFGAADSYNVMIGLDVDETYVYIRDTLECAVVYALDISTNFDYSNYTSYTGDVPKDTSGGYLDLRKFLLHSRAVSPMVLAVRTKNYAVGDTNLAYTSPLNYPTFQFGYVRAAITTGLLTANVWIYAPLAAQGSPVLVSDGFTSSLSTGSQNGQPVFSRGSIVTLRNPAIVSTNSATVNL